MKKEEIAEISQFVAEKGYTKTDHLGDIMRFSKLCAIEQEGIRFYIDLIDIYNTESIVSVFYAVFDKKLIYYNISDISAYTVSRAKCSILENEREAISAYFDKMIKSVKYAKQSETLTKEYTEAIAKAYTEYTE